MLRMGEQVRILERIGVIGSTLLQLILFMQSAPALASSPIVEVQGIEVIQAVQSMSKTDKSLNNLVPLIANKKTVARVYFTRISGNSVTITATLVLTRPDASTKLVNPSKLRSSLTNTLTVTSTAMLTPKREDLKKSLNFFLPDSWTAAGPLTLSIEQVKKTNGPTIQCSNCGATSQIQVTFEPAPPFTLALIGLTYKKGNTTYQPRELDFVRIRSWLRRAYPTATVENLWLPNHNEEFRLVPYDTTLNEPPGENLFTQDGCMFANKQLLGIRAQEIDGDPHLVPITHYYGIVHNGGDFMKGCSLGYLQSATSEGPSPAAGPTGLPTGQPQWKWDKDGSYGDWYAGHELGHTVGRLHSFVCNSQCAQNPSDCAYLNPHYPYPHGLLSGPDTLNNPYFVGLDIGDDVPITTSSGTAISPVPPTVYPGTSSHDVMTTKCNNRWISDYTYKGILQRLREEDAVEDITAAIPAELLVTGSAHHPNLRLVNDVINARTLDQGNTEAAQGEPDQQPPVKNRSKVQVQSGNFLNVIGDVNLTKGTGRISYVNPVSWATVRPTTSDRTVVLRVTEANETVNEYPVSVQVHPSHGKGSDEKGIVDAIIPRVTNIEQLDLVLHNTPVATRRAKAGVPQVKNIHLEARKAPVASNPSKQQPHPHPSAPSRRLSERNKSIGSNSGESKAVESPKKSELPAVRIQRHSDGYTVVTWEATDPDGDSLTFSVQLSNDRKIWRTYAIGLQENELVLSEAQLKSLKELYVKVIVSDGLNGTAFISEPLSPLGSG